MQPKSQQFRLLALTGALFTAGLIACATPVHARVTKLVIDMKTSPAFGGATFGSAGQYETIAGHVFGETRSERSAQHDHQRYPAGPKNAAGKVEYMATFFLVKPIDMSKSSHLLWQDVPNRGGRITLAAASRNDGDVGLSSGWQGDNSGDTAQTPPANATTTPWCPSRRIRTARR